MTEYAAIEKCENCGGYGSRKYHTCPPAFEVTEDPARPEWARTVHADDAEDAAVAYRETAEEDVEAPEEFDVWVRPAGEDEWSQWTVLREWEPTYSASEVAEVTT